MIKINNLCFSYKNDKTPIKVIDGITFDINKNEIISLVGPSGCGKTTLVKIIAGYLKPSGGDIVIDGILMKSPERDRIVISQDDDLFDWMTVEDNVKFAMSKPNKHELNSLVNLVRLSGYKFLYPYQLSGGMKKRVSLARALAAHADYILMDEPFSSIDYNIREKLYFELNDIWNKTKKTIVLVTHDIEEAIYLSKRIIIFSSSPMKIKRMFNIPFGYPRKRDIISSSKFLKIRKMIQKNLENK